jgi:biotin transport system substrate-specific component
MSVLVESAVRRRSRSSLLADVTLVLVGSMVVAGLAQLSVRLPFTPVPVTGQTLAVLVVGASLGPVRGGISLLLYLAEGAAGLPVFAEGGAGLAPLLLPSVTGGYLWGFVVAAFVVGSLAERRWDRRLSSAIGAMLLGEIVIFFFGVVWLSAAVGVPGSEALELGLYPFVLGELVKLLVAAGVLPAAWKLSTPPDLGRLNLR